MSKKALILGCGGQDGSYLAELLLHKGYEVHGTYRRSSVDNLTRIARIRHRVVLHRADLQDGASVERVVREVRPNEIYNEADQDHVGFSKETPQVSIDITAGAVQRLLETVLRVDKSIRVFQPLSATMFGNNGHSLQSEYSEFVPTSPYACAKLAAYYFCQHYRREHGLHVCCGIMFNHESPRRGADYLLQRIVRQAKAIRAHRQSVLKIANGGMKVDIGYAPEFMDAAYRVMQLDTPDDYVIGTGNPATIREYAIWALEAIGVIVNHKIYLEEYDNPSFANEPTLIANFDKVWSATKWEPKTYRQKLIQKLIEGEK